MASNSRRTGPPDGYYDTGEKDSKGRPIYKKTPTRSNAGSSGPPPGSETPMDDYENPGGAQDIPMDEPVDPGGPDDDFSGELPLAHEIEGILGDHERVRRVTEDDGVFEVTFRSGDQLVINPDSGEDDEVELTHYTEDAEGEPVVETAAIKRADLGQALSTIADNDDDHDGDNNNSMLPLMAAKGLYMAGRRRRRRKRRRKRQGSQRLPRQQGLSAYFVQRFFDMAFPGREH